MKAAAAWSRKVIARFRGRSPAWDLRGIAEARCSGSSWIRVFESLDAQHSECLPRRGAGTNGLHFTRQFRISGPNGFAGPVESMQGLEVTPRPTIARIQLCFSPSCPEFSGSLVCQSRPENVISSSQAVLAGFLIGDRTDQDVCYPSHPPPWLNGMGGAVPLWCVPPSFASFARCLGELTD